MKKILFFATLCMPLFMSSCGSDDDETTGIEAPNTSYTLTVNVGETRQLSASSTGEPWLSDNAFVATVNAENQLTGQHVGSTKIRSGASTLTVTVKGREESDLTVVTDWDKSQQVVKTAQTVGTLQSGSPENTLYYKALDAEGSQVMYHFTGPQLKAACLQVPEAKAPSFLRYLQERFWFEEDLDDSNSTPAIGYDANEYAQAGTFVYVAPQGRDVLVTFFKAKDVESDLAALEQVQAYMTVFNLHVMMRTTSLTLYVGDSAPIETNFSEDTPLEYRDQNSFVAHVDKNGQVTGVHVGTTTVTVNGIPVAVTVKGKYNLYTEPVLEWGAKKTYVNNNHQAGGTLNPNLALEVDGQKTDDVYMYSGCRGVMFMYYFFGLNNQLNEVELFLNTNKGSDIEPFLSERYMLIPLNDGIIVGIDAYTEEEAHTVVLSYMEPKFMGSPTVGHPYDIYYEIVYIPSATFFEVKGLLRALQAGETGAKSMAPMRIERLRKGR